MGEYLLAIGGREAAQTQLEMLQEMPSDHPLTWRLFRQLCRGPLRRLLAALRENSNGS